MTGDPGVLQQGIWQLCEGVIDTMDAGGRIELRLERLNGDAALTLAATQPAEGRRVPAADMQRLQARLAEAGVTLTADSARQVWTFRMPMRPVREAVALPSPSPDDFPMPGPQALRDRCVMVLDDDAPTREVLVEALEDLGARALAFGRGKDLLQALAATSHADWPNVLLCDIALHEEDGYTVLRDVRRLESQREVPLLRRVTAIALSGHAQPQDRIRAMMAGFQIHLPKPVRMAELIAAIQAHTAQGTELPER